jgi:F420-non-reducing hydrogenase small subunit
VKEEKKFAAFRRPFEMEPDANRCLLEQGLVCQGLATREGCGGLCTAVGAGCRGCFGKAEAVMDAGAKMVSAISSTIDSADAAVIEEISNAFVDLAGTFYRYTLPEQCTLMSGAAEE